MDVKPAPKKSVALSGIVAGNTALCTVGRTGNDLPLPRLRHSRRRRNREFEEIAHLLVHGSRRRPRNCATTKPSTNPYADCQ